MHTHKDTQICFSQNGVIRYYSLARFALIEALRLAGVGVGSRVLLPEYLCRDLLASLHLLGASPVWYEVSEGLIPLGSQDEWPLADVVLVVNYFGFPQDLQIFQEYAKRSGAMIIEDNAHGYLSRDHVGRWLGCRVNLGIFSMRKTLRMPDGAALWVEGGDNFIGTPSQLPFIGRGFLSSQKVKLQIRQLPIFGEPLYRAVIKFVRLLRKVKTGRRFPMGDPESERVLPGCPEPWRFLLPRLDSVAWSAEVERRRNAYIKCATEGLRVGVRPVFKFLPDNCAPYAYAFRARPETLVLMSNFAEQNLYDVVQWPDLPDEIMRKDRARYRDVYLINFMW